jgi:prolyl-tRNA editing enzyme YbaK/EbsC (Cys-tRNA(Pro) deacylase)
MENVLQNPSVQRVSARLKELGVSGEVHVLSDSARTAQEAADALGILVGQVASSIVFKLDDESPLLVITSGRHRVDTKLVAEKLGIAKLHRVDADYVKEKSGFSIGGVPPMGFVSKQLSAYPAPLPLGKLLLRIRHFAALLPRVALPELAPLSVAGFRVRL